MLWANVCRNISNILFSEPFGVNHRFLSDSLTHFAQIMVFDTAMFAFNTSSIVLNVPADDAHFDSKLQSWP